MDQMAAEVVVVEVDVDSYFVDIPVVPVADGDTSAVVVGSLVVPVVIAANLHYTLWGWSSCDVSLSGLLYLQHLDPL